MARTCTVCLHPDRKAIDKALLAGEPVRSLASRYVTAKGPLGRMALQRHKEEHLTEAMTKAKDAKEAAHGVELLQQVRRLESKAISLLLAAEKSGDFRTALSGVREARGCLELLAKLMGQINDGPTINVVVSPQWLNIRAVVVQALAPYPDARATVAAALVKMETDVSE